MMQATIITERDDREQAYRIRTTVFVEEQGVPAEEELDAYEEVSTHVLVRVGGKPAATGRVRLLDGYGKLERICVLPAFRGTGAGKAVTLALEAAAAGQGAVRFKLNAQTQAAAFYEKLGYRTVSGEFLDAGIPHVTMVKDGAVPERSG